MAELPVAEPREIKLDATRLQRAYDLLDEWTSGPTPAVPSGAILVGRNGKIVKPRHFGRQGPEADAAAIRPDSLFLIASITKPLTYLGAMLLVERGLLNLSDHVTRYIPEFAAHHKEDTRVVHLFTHTSGLPDMLDNNAELRKQHAPLSKFIEGAIRDTVPLFPPGTKVSYQSMGTLIVAELIQRLSGQPIAEFLQKEIFEPLGLKSTSLGIGRLDRARIVRLRTGAAPTDHDWNSEYWLNFGAPWGGLFTTPEDFAVICQLFVNGGRFGDVRLLSPFTVERMTTNRLDDLPDLDEASRRTQPWGLGWKLNHPTLDSLGDLVSPRAYGHSGASGTMVWIDRARNGFCILFTNALLSENAWRLRLLSNAVAAAFD